MRKACFIIPYFGSFPNTFPVFLKTCGENPDFDWLILTDDHTAYDYPENVHCVYTTFAALVHRIQALYDFPICLDWHYKLCDFRAAFGEIFAPELQNYRFWGHCDVDQYFGTISHFITDEILDTYDKILCLGHFTLFRNTPRINGMYRIPDRKWNQSYQAAFSEHKHWIFDEWPSGNTCINRIMKQEQVKTYYAHDSFCDLVPFISRFQRYIFDHEAEDWVKEPIGNTVFTWEKGMLQCCHKTKDSGVQRREMLYVHIRQRKMDTTDWDAKAPAFCLYPNKIGSYASEAEIPVKEILDKTFRRSLWKPDERARTLVRFNGFRQAVMRRIGRILKGVRR